MTNATFRVTENSGRLWDVSGEGIGTPEAAALEHVRTAHHRGRMTALRTTGARGLSGFFRAYRPVKGGGLAATGDAFHVTSL